MSDLQRPGFAKRFLAPTLAALALMLASRAVYFNSGLLDSRAAYHTVALLSGLVHFMSVILVPVFIYPFAFFRGAGAAERIIASSINPALWVFIDAYHVSEAFNFLESLYYGLNIGSVIFIFMFSQMSVCEMACRWRQKRSGAGVRVLTPAVFAPFVFLAILGIILSRQGGAFYFNLMLEGYAALFNG